MKLLSRRNFVVWVAAGISLVICAEIAIAGRVVEKGSSASNGLLSRIRPNALASKMRRAIAKQRLFRGLHAFAMEIWHPWGLRFVGTLESRYPRTREFDRIAGDFERAHGPLTHDERARVDALRAATLGREIESALLTAEVVVDLTGDAAYQHRATDLLTREARPLAAEPQRFAALLDRLHRFTQTNGLSERSVLRRFHLGTAELQGRLAPGMQRALDAIARYDLADGASGSAFFVMHTTEGRGWMMAALHRQHAPDGKAQFFLGGADQEPVPAGGSPIRNHC